MTLNERSSQDYETEAAATRQRLADSLEQLSDRLTPGQIFDELLTYAKGGGGSFSRALTNAARENPIPSLLIGAGCMMFMSEKTGLNRYFASRRSVAGQPIGARVGEPVYDGGQSAGFGFRSVGSNLRRATGVADEQTSNVIGGAKRGAEALAAKMSSASQRIREAAHDTRDQLMDSTEQLRQGAREAGEGIQEQFASIRACPD